MWLWGVSKTHLKGRWLNDGRFRLPKVRGWVWVSSDTRAAATLLRSVRYCAVTHTARCCLLNDLNESTSVLLCHFELCSCSWEPPKKSLRLPAAVSFHTGGFSSSRIHTAVEKMRNPLLLCNVVSEKGWGSHIAPPGVSRLLKSYPVSC